MFRSNVAADSIAKKMIAARWPELGSGDLTIHHVVEEKDKPPTKAGCKEFASVAVVPPVYQHLIEDDCEASYVIVYHGYSWSALSEDGRRGLVAHMLRHIAREVDDKSGAVRWVIKGHDFEGFEGELEQDGAWNRGLRGAVKTARQMSMDDAVAATGSVAERVVDAALDALEDAENPHRKRMERTAGGAGGIEAITVSGGGRSVTLTGKGRRTAQQRRQDAINAEATARAAMANAPVPTVEDEEDERVEVGQTGQTAVEIEESEAADYHRRAGGDAEEHDAA
jgi:hypothetical protein